MPTPTLTIIFLNMVDGTFKAALPEQLQLRQLEPGLCALGVNESRPKLVDGKPQSDADGKPVIESSFTPFINYPVNITPAKLAPKVELATEIPASLKKPSRARKVQ